MVPNTLIIGGMKCGTTSLNYYLNLHPEIFMSSKRHRFFIKEGNWNRGLDWYEAQFSTKNKIIGETTAAYTNFPIYKGIPERIKKHYPNIKLIYLVRNPIERAFLHYQHLYFKGEETRPFSIAIKDESKGYLSKSLQFLQLKQYLAFFPKDQIHIIRQDHLIHNTNLTLKKVFEFLEIDPTFYSEEFSKMLHQTKEKRMIRPEIEGIASNLIETGRKYLPDRLRWIAKNYLLSPITFKPFITPIDKALKSELAAYFRRDVQQLSEFIQEPLQDWLTLNPKSLLIER